MKLWRAQKPFLILYGLSPLLNLSNIPERFLNLSAKREVLKSVLDRAVPQILSRVTLIIMIGHYLRIPNTRDLTIEISIFFGSLPQRRQVARIILMIMDGPLMAI